MTERQENPYLIVKTMESLSEKAFTIGFARRFATYKRAYLLFNNIERLSKILNNPDMPVQIVFAGKAHPADKAGQDVIKHIIEISKRPEFIGKIIFVENYDMELGQMLTQGVDLWMNTPTRPLEASGTSGQKAVMNGVINFSVLDGWWAEGYLPYAGWALPEEQTYIDHKFQDQLDAETMYNIIEFEIVPTFYERNMYNVPEKWVSYIKNCIADIAPRFTMKRMLDDYVNFYYNELFERSDRMSLDNHHLAKEIATWKKRMVNAWNKIKLVKMEYPNLDNKSLALGDNFDAELTFDVNNIHPDNIGVEVLFGRKEKDEVKEVVFKTELEIKDHNENLVTYTCSIPTTKAGVYDFAFRMYPKNDYLPHRQDFNLTKWY